ncbi:MAG: hypothetical protein LBI27_09645 [Clostridiales bacterium]|jgi:hypothetical protein|nr:hypothetical protein [Clostridiales bacterium]
MSHQSSGKNNRGGSMDWMQTIINTDEMRILLDEKIGAGSIKWLSPLESANYQEYQLNENPIAQEFGFNNDMFTSWWRFSRQPQWDAIGKSENGTIILIEAKAHIKECESECHAGYDSYPLILNAFKKTHANLSATIPFNENTWMNKYYQTGNRFLFWDNLKPIKDVLLVFLIFINVPREDFRTDAQTWNNHMNSMITSMLGYGASELPSGIRIINYLIN